MNTERFAWQESDLVILDENDEPKTLGGPGSGRYPKGSGQNPQSGGVYVGKGVDAKVAKRVQKLVDQMGDTLELKAVRLQSEPIAIDKHIRSETASGAMFVFDSPGYGKKGDSILRIGGPSEKSPESVLLHENGHAIDLLRLHISDDPDVFDTWYEESTAYIAKLGPHKPGTPLGQRYYAKKIIETVAQSISIIHGKQFGVKVNDSEQFSKAFPKTMTLIQERLKK